MKPRKSNNRRVKHQDAHPTQHAAPAAELPDAVLAMILQHIPLKQRLTTCAIVSKAWAAVVASTTADVSTLLPHWSCRHQHLQAWLQQCGEQVVTMRLSSYALWRERLAIELPCGKLSELKCLSVDGLVLQLRIEQVHVSTRSSVSRNRSLTHRAAVLARAGPAFGTGCLSKLQQLNLQACSMSVQHFLQLPMLTALDSLHVDRLSLLTRTGKRVSSVNKPLRAVLQQLTHLSSLTLTRVVVKSDNATASALAPISSMQHLQHLSLDDQTCPDFTALLPVLPTSLALLRLDGVDISPPVQHVQALDRLGSLRELVLIGVLIDPQVLCACSPQLTCLVMGGCDCTTAQGVFTDNDVAISTLFSALARFTQLQELELSNINFDEHPHLQQFSAITASSQLTELRLSDSNYTLLPKGALQHMLPAGKQLPQLRVLHLSSCADMPGCATAEDLAGVSSCCAALQKLLLRHVVAPHVVGFTGLLPLQSSLLELDLQGAAFGDTAAAVVAQLTNLRDLTWQDAGRLSDEGVRHLTALQQLTRLVCGYCNSVELFANNKLLEEVGLKGAIFYPGCISLEGTGSSGKGLRPDVWKQLQRLFEACQQRRKTRSSTKRSG